jgi:hypothetical protein
MLFSRIWMALAFMVSTGYAADLYVSPDGRDTWSGRLERPNARRTDGPMATLAAARDAARKLPASEPRRILLKGGKYFLGETVVLDARDSGLSIEAAPGEKPVLYGGRRITGWRKEGKRFWSAKLPDVLAGRWDFRMLVVDDKIAARARLPQSGTFTHLTDFKVRWMSTTGGGWQRKPTEEELTTLEYQAGDLGPWLEVKNAELTVYHSWDESLVTLNAHDPSTRKLRFATPAGHPPGGFGVHKYVVWNVREGMKQPGQWYLDRKAGKVVYWPLPGQSMKNTEVIAPDVESVLRIEGSAAAPVKQVTVRGLTLSVTNTPAGAGGFGAERYDGAIAVHYCDDCRIRELTIYNSGGQGIKARDTRRLAIEANEIRQTGAGGAIVRGSGFSVVNNRIHDAGVIYPSAIALSLEGQDGLAGHNEIHDTPYSAITASGAGHRIEGNRIYRAMQVLQDGAGIYITFCKRIVVRGNHISDIADKGGSGASAYYLDEQAEDCLVENNLAENVAYPSHNHMARRNVIRDNVFIASGDARITLHKCSDYTFERNVVYAGGALEFHSPEGAIARMPSNVLFSGKGKVELVTLKDYTAAARSPLEARDGTVVEDPLFLNRKEKDYRFQPGSPAMKLGIEPLDVTPAGPSR